jgi:hypothetical protein
MDATDDGKMQEGINLRQVGITARQRTRLAKKDDEPQLFLALLWRWLII